jgi:hypothetical protein
VLLPYHVTYHWTPRSNNWLNWASDLLAGMSRRALMEMPVAGSPMESARSSIAKVGLNDVQGRAIDPQSYNSGSFSNRSCHGKSLPSHGGLCSTN